MPPKKKAGAGHRKRTSNQPGKGPIKKAINDLLIQGLHMLTGNVFRQDERGVKARAALKKEREDEKFRAQYRPKGNGRKRKAKK